LRERAEHEEESIQRGQIIGILGEAEAGSPIKALCAAHNISTATYHAWKRKIESFHDKLRDECLNRELGSLLEAPIILESWRVEYNAVRPHSALGYRTPNQYAQELANQFDRGLRAPKPRAARRGRRSGGTYAWTFTDQKMLKSISKISWFAGRSAARKRQTF
jgi:Integrase core domain/Transposase